MGGNRIGDAGATALSNAIAVSFFLFCVFSFLIWATPLPGSPPISCHVPLQENKTLQTLDLRWNKIGNAGATALSKGIAVSFVLLCLFIFSMGYPPLR